VGRTLQQQSSSFPCAGCKKQCTSELLGTYLLVFLGPGSIVAASLWGLPSLEALLFVAAVFGGTVASVILLLGRFSGAHINPAISVGSAVAGLLKRELFVPYLAFQVTGALLAGICLRIVFGSGGLAIHLGSTQLAVGMSPIEGVSLEIGGTFFLALSALIAASFVKSPAKQATLVGGTLFVLILLIGPLTGASFNPARSLGPALLSGYLSGQIIYYVGPIVGAACAGLMFGVVRKSYGKKRGGATKLDLVCVC
jgi:glycerol uptake facilitator-like aquaporin